MMSDDILSQEEIEALLSGKGLEETESSDASTSEETETADFKELTELESDTIGEL